MEGVSPLVPLLEHALVHRSNTSAPSSLKVICAWPVSGQYGPGTRILYYVLVVACVVARKVEWIRTACLSAALIFPAVAAFHGIVLATLHTNGAVDMDIYGAFQLCAIGILTAPITVRLSKTYFQDPGRGVIFLWTALLLAGLVSLTVEFMRVDATTCPDSDPASISWATSGGVFTYGSNCSMTCTPENGPVSPLRREAADNIYVVPIPDELSVNATALIAVGCCVPAILSLVSMLFKILDDNWKKFSNGKRRQKSDEPIEATSQAIIKPSTRTYQKIRYWGSLIEILIFSAFVLAILVKGEMNFWSAQMKYQTEPMQSVGQWAPVVGTALAILGSVYLLLSADMEAAEKEDGQSGGLTVGNCPNCGGSGSDTDSNSRQESRTDTGRPSSDIEMAILRPVANQTTEPAHKRKIARFFNAASAKMTIKAHEKFEHTGFIRNAKSTYPEIPGERYRNYRKTADKCELLPKPERRPSADGFISSKDSVDNGEGGSRIPQDPTQLLVHAPGASRARSGPPRSNLPLGSGNDDLSHLI
ncbi:hypothetical protein PENCOP_c012G06403 [Penicillium coprophilum]|uniref:Uncharacterized protein n=1 Tax=Penicillium coprophilum TaxID=36646 RepID=A0A1V6UE03_9EURO|nr:hypothetical protein PENCOP_c012G06403 [Penicillium coprophilum]